MNTAQIHLALNHVPLFFSLIGGGILIAGIIKKNESFKTLALWLLVTGAVFTIPVFFTGEGTEEMVENLPGVNENAIETHEAMAKISLAVIAATGITALAGLFFRANKSIGKFILSVCFFLSLASFALMAQTAHSGGKIRHSELQKGASAYNEEEEKNDNGGGNENDDD